MRHGDGESAAGVARDSGTASGMVEVAMGSPRRAGEPQRRVRSLSGLKMCWQRLNSRDGVLVCVAVVVGIGPSPSPGVLLAQNLDG